MDYRVIKENDLFLLTDEKGDIPESHPYGLGLYTADTRFLSRLDLLINGERPILLASDAAENYMAEILLTNPHMEEEGELKLWRESVEIKRTRFIYGGVLYETITLKNYFPKKVSFDLSVHMDADFADMFIVRGFQSGNVGKRTGQKAAGDGLTFTYMGADDVYRATCVAWDREASKVTEEGVIHFPFSLEHAEEQEVTLSIAPQIGGKKPEVVNRAEAVERLQKSYQDWEGKITRIETDFEPLQRLVTRGIADLRVLLTDTGFGEFPVAGLPWFGVPFGRDSLIAALQMLAFNPEIAKGTLLTMADSQGTEVNPWRDEQPGKIMHEMRYGELAATGQIPFTPYYGTIDATPLFLILLTQYVKWTGDLPLAEKLSPQIEAALNWIDQYGDRDGDLFVEYHQEAAKGIANQGWKDSGDSVVHKSGEYAETPIALSEVQGYVYGAKTGIADLFEKLGRNERAQELRKQAEELKQRFDADFWMEDSQYYAIALDKDKKQVESVTSNPGHLLFSEMLEDSRADAVIQTLLSPRMFSGFGIRTMAEGEAGYNPISYHDGSIWPHDNSLIILGMSQMNRPEAASAVISGLIEAAGHFEYDRLPELYCGYDSSLGKVVKYPVACSPQAWAAGTPLIFIQSLLGLFPDAIEETIRLSPNLLDGMNRLLAENISIGRGHLSVLVTRTDGGLDVSVLKNTTGLTIL
ncbi:glycogen debranching N-terminal domain-containing protein [Peribacillus sp. SCS-37]|uniref:amylo-alpha-1,6-glucosidase n=1 Tax=Paraperibacillus esterisolvens TaxID=3115296 RepID=UPI00390621BE